MIITVLCSVFAHGITAFPGANWYANRMMTMSDQMPEMLKIKAMRTRLTMKK